MCMFVGVIVACLHMCVLYVGCVCVCACVCVCVLGVNLWRAQQAENASFQVVLHARMCMLGS